MRVLALSPYHGGSHRQFLSDWSQRSVHEFVECTLPARHLKWRMRQASIGLSEQVQRLADQGQQFDAIWTTSMCNAAELRGLLPRQYRGLPLCVYFHENQVAYPSRSQARDYERGWDVNLPLNNWLSVYSADTVWFNSEFNRSTLIEGLRALLRRMPDKRSLSTLERIRAKSEVQSPGIDLDYFTLQKEGNLRRGQPLTIAWVARWEHDKRPELFVEAARTLSEQGVPFRLVCLGQSFKDIPLQFEVSQQNLSKHIMHFGFAADRGEYRRRLWQSDVVVSTADHEFFGLALLEATACGCQPLLPDRVVYPELYDSSCCYPCHDDETVVRALVLRLAALAEEKQRYGLLEPRPRILKLALDDLGWAKRAPGLDDALARLVPSSKD